MGDSQSAQVGKQRPSIAEAEITVELQPIGRDRAIVMFLGGKAVQTFRQPTRLGDQG